MARKLKINDLKDRVSVQTSTHGKSGNTWAEDRRQWAAIDPLSAHSQGMGHARGAKATYRVTMREAPQVTVGQSLVFRGVRYEVESRLVVPVTHDFGAQELFAFVLEPVSVPSIFAQEFSSEFA